MPIGHPGIRHFVPSLLSRPLVLLTACISLAGVGLAWFMVRTVIQERAVAAQEVRDATISAASRVAEGIVPELERLERGLRIPGADESGAMPATPAAGGSETRNDDSVALVVGAGGTAVWAAGRVLYELEPDVPRAAEPTWPAALRAAEALEIRSRDHTGAIAAYRAMVGGTASIPELRLAVQQRLARSLRKAGRATEALAVLQQIIDEHRSDGSAAAAAAWYDRCALIREASAGDTCAVAFYAGLVDGRWRLEKPLYEFYADSALRWTQELASRTDVALLMATETTRLALTAAAQAALRAWRAEPRHEPAGHLVLIDHGRPVVVAWRNVGQDRAVLLVLGPASAATRVFAPLVHRYASGHAVSISTNRIVVFPLSGGETGRAASAQNVAAKASQDAATITVDDGPIVWRVTARPDTARDARRGVTTRTGVYLGTLVLMLLSVALAGYFAIRTVRQELEVARLKSEFVSTVSHEFRSPLSAISHLAELLDARRVSDEERKREYYRLILGESGRLRRLVENLLNFARIEEGRQQFQLEPMNVGRWLRPAVDEFQASSAAAGKKIVVEIAPDLPPVRADTEAMTTVLGNLLDNAVKYSPDTPCVWVEAGVATGAIEIRVRDEGVGIAAEDQAHVFERFYRARDAGTVAGTGLGLALVQRIVAAHGGTVDVESRPGKGSTFRVRLPAFVEEQA